jgi:hypothetical protein
MPKITGPFWVYKRPKTKKFQITLYPASGLPLEVCKNWQRKGFSRLPLELAAFWDPKTKAAAEASAMALVEYLRNQLRGAEESVLTEVRDTMTAGVWLERFASLENNPRADRLTGKNRGYSPGTIATYSGTFRLHIKGDPFLDLKMADIEEEDALAFAGRVGLRLNKYGKPLAGTRTYTIAIKFIRMAFREYGRTHRKWINPFSGIDAPIDLKKMLRRQ